MPIKDKSDLKKYPGIKGGLCNTFKLYSRHRKPEGCKPVLFDVSHDAIAFSNLKCHISKTDTSNSLKPQKKSFKPMTLKMTKNKKSEVHRVLDPNKDLNLGKGLGISKGEDSKSCYEQSLNYSNSSIDSGTENNLDHVLEQKLEAQRKNNYKTELEIVLSVKEQSQKVARSACVGSNEGSNLTVFDETTSFMKMCSKYSSKPNIENSKLRKSQKTNPVQGTIQTSHKVDQNSNLELFSKACGKILKHSEPLISHACRICGKKYKTEAGLKVRMNSIH